MADDKLTKAEPYQKITPPPGYSGWTCGRCGGPVSGRFATCSNCGLDGMEKVTKTEPAAPAAARPKAAGRFLSEIEVKAILDNQEQVVQPSQTILNLIATIVMVRANVKHWREQWDRTDQELQSYVARLKAVEAATEAEHAAMATDIQAAEREWYDALPEEARKILTLLDRGHLIAIMARVAADASKTKPPAAAVADIPTPDPKFNFDYLLKAAKCVYLATEESVAADLSGIMYWAAQEIHKLRDMAPRWVDIDSAPEHVRKMALFKKPRLGELVVQTVMDSDGNFWAVEWDNPSTQPLRALKLPARPR